MVRGSVGNRSDWNPMVRTSRVGRGVERKACRSSIRLKARSTRSSFRTWMFWLATKENIERNDSFPRRAASHESRRFGRRRGRVLGAGEEGRREEEPSDSIQVEEKHPISNVSREGCLRMASMRDGLTRRWSR